LRSNYNTPMKTRALGNTGLVVSELGLGAGPLGGTELDDGAAVALIHAALDLGITLIDTAPSYGRSELRIGEALVGRRDRVVLSTKLGYGVPGVPDWTGPCITAGIDLALTRLRTTWLDVAHLHSCPLEILLRGDVLDALDAAIRAGTLRVAAYSGDNAELAWAIDSGRFGVVQCSVNLVDQRALDAAVPRAFGASIGVLAKRTLANAVWRATSEPATPDRAEYWRRLNVMGLSATAEQSLRFVLAQRGVSSALVGTTTRANLEAAAATVALGPLDDAAVTSTREAFRRCDRGWDGVI
jgi:aryl-alcohol dehydrogenase-like predicted oxidoreductase